MHLLRVCRRSCGGVGLCFLTLVLQGCSSLSRSTLSPVVIAISPTSASVQTSKTQQFNVSVDAANTNVTWQINGVTSGDAIHGTISAAGLYTAPMKVPNQPTVTVSVVSQADSRKIASAIVTITSAQPSLSITTTSLPNGQVGLAYRAVLVAASAL